VPGATYLENQREEYAEKAQAARELAAEYRKLVQ
jgi:hypothetical protein